MLALLPGLAPTGRITYLIAQHMAPDGHGELTARLLNRESALEIALAKDGDELQPDRIYLIPSGHDGLLQNGRIRLRAPSEGTLSTPSINVLFSSIAEECGNRAIGIILSGAGTDGVAGCRAIKARGGITIAQDPETARFNGMPAAAIEAGTIDRIIRENDIAGELLAMLPGVSPVKTDRTSPAQKTPDQDTGIQHLLDLMLDATGVDFTGYKEETLQRRLERRLSSLGITSMDNYFGFIAKNPPELGILQHLFLVSLSSFFRDRDSFKAAEQALRPIIGSKRKGEAIKLWVPGCASGEEVYTLAIILAEILGGRLADYNIGITGTDLNQEALEMAQNGLYRQTAFKETEPELIARYFLAKGQHYQVNDTIRAICLFEKRDIISDQPLRSLDMVSCRNLLIYLKGKLQDQLISKFHQSLLPHGLLFIGQSETTGPMGNALFTPIDSHHKIYRKR